MKCDYCEYRCSWDCEDFKVSNDYICERFRLDFDTLTEHEKKAVQRQLMMKGIDDE